MKTKETLKYVYVLERYTGVKHLLNFDKRHKKGLTYDEMTVVNIFNDVDSAMEYLSTVEVAKIAEDTKNIPGKFWGFSHANTKRLVYTIYKVPIGLYNEPFSPILYGYGKDYTHDQCVKDFMMFVVNEAGTDFVMLNIDTDTDGRVIYGRCGTDFKFDEQGVIILSKAEEEAAEVKENEEKVEII